MPFHCGNSTVLTSRRARSVLLKFSVLYCYILITIYSVDCKRRAWSQMIALHNSLFCAMLPAYCTHGETIYCILCYSSVYICTYNKIVRTLYLKPLMTCLWQYILTGSHLADNPIPFTRQSNIADSNSATNGELIRCHVVEQNRTMGHSSKSKSFNWPENQKIKSPPFPHH